MSEKILVALSGGVDSAVAAAILKKASYSLTAVTMKICAQEEPSGSPSARHGCYGTGESEDIEDARRVAAYLEIPENTVSATIHRTLERLRQQWPQPQEY